MLAVVASDPLALLEHRDLERFHEVMRITLDSVSGLRRSPRHHQYTSFAKLSKPPFGPDDAEEARWSVTCNQICGLP